MPINLALAHRRLKQIAPNIVGIALDSENTLANAELHFEGADQAEIDAAYAWIGATTDAEVSIPNAISKFQFKVHLHRSGRLEDVKTALQDAGVSEEVRLYWSEAKSIGRDSALVTLIQSTLGYTNAQVDTFFANASEIGEE